MGSRAVAALVVLGVLAGAPSAVAQSADSTNWAGYAVKRPGVSFRSVRAEWTQPSPSCRPGSRTYSSYWVGLGGFSADSPALEQIGTEIDCTRSGTTSSTAWYETVPSPSFGISHTVRPGDVMTASVTVTGNVVRMVLHDVTRGWTFNRTRRVSPIDVTSAEWIVEAPSECRGSICAPLPLANFGSATFTSASATTVLGHTGTLSDPNWQLTKIMLRPAGRQFAVAGTLAGGATPSAPRPGGSSFAVDYSLVSLQLPGSARDGWIRAGRVVHGAPTAGP